MESFDFTRTPSSERLSVPKLRTSCDACLQAKVKCEKTDAACRRCTSFGITCQFSPSQRSGKPPSKKNGPGAKSKQPRKTGSPSALSHEERSRPSSSSTKEYAPNVHRFPNPSHSQQDQIMQQTTSFTTSARGPNMPAPEMRFGNDSLPPFAAPIPPATYSDVDSLWLQGLDPGSEFVDGQGISNDINPPLPFDFKNSIAGIGEDMFRTSDPQSHTLLQTSFSTQACLGTSGHNCHQLALQALTELHRGTSDRYEVDQHTDPLLTPPSDYSGSDRSPPGYVVAVEIVTQILKCQCTLAEDTVLSCGLIGFKVVAHFKDVLTTIHVEEAGPHPPPPPPPPLQEHDTQITHLCLAKWERDARVMIRQGSILHELRKIVMITSLMTERHKKRRDDGAATEICGVLAKSLKARLAEAMQQVANVSSAAARRYALSDAGPRIGD